MTSEYEARRPVAAAGATTVPIGAAGQGADERDQQHQRGHDPDAGFHPLHHVQRRDRTGFGFPPSGELCFPPELPGVREAPTIRQPVGVRGEPRHPRDGGVHVPAGRADGQVGGEIGRRALASRRLDDRRLVRARWRGERIGHDRPPPEPARESSPASRRRARWSSTRTLADFTLSAAAIASCGAPST